MIDAYSIAAMAIVACAAGFLAGVLVTVAIVKGWWD